MGKPDALDTGIASFIGGFGNELSNVRNRQDQLKMMEALWGNKVAATNAEKEKIMKYDKDLGDRKYWDPQQLKDSKYAPGANSPKLGGLTAQEAMLKTDYEKAQMAWETFRTKVANPNMSQDPVGYAQFSEMTPEQKNSYIHAKVTDPNDPISSIYNKVNDPRNKASYDAIQKKIGFNTIQSGAPATGVDSGASMPGVGSDNVIPGK